MAKRFSFRSTRDSNNITNRFTRLRSSFTTHSRRLRPGLTFFEDFRRWEPRILDDRFPRAIPRSFLRPRKPHVRVFDSRRRLAMPRLYVPFPTGMGFAEPYRVFVCARRAARREVLHAFRKTGRGGQKSPRFTDNSLIHCR